MINDLERHPHVQRAEDRYTGIGVTTESTYANIVLPAPAKKRTSACLGSFGKFLGFTHEFLGTKARHQPSRLPIF
jgi:hypothetical protein